ncbi:MAG: nitroreductase/quinone reductase family protein [Acidimicrobiales bacterium]
MATRTDEEWLALNQRVIEEFRANAGQCGGAFKGNPMVLLTTVGARSGQPRTSPVTFTTVSGDPDVRPEQAGSGERDGWVLIASKAGSDSHPAWFHNLVANPAVTVEVGAQRFAARARIATEPERTRLFNARIAVMPRFGGYLEMTDRVIPLVVVEPIGPT